MKKLLQLKYLITSCTFSILFFISDLSAQNVQINGGGFIYPTISAAVTAAFAGDIIEAAPGVYLENVLLNKDNLILRSSGGKGVTTIQGTFAGGNGTVMVAGGTNGVKIGQPGKGFTIIGFDGNGAIESAALYLLGAHTNITIEDNDIQADGDAGLLSNFNAAIDGIYIKGNMFSGRTFLTANPGGCGFGTQGDPGNNVPRQLVTMGGGAGVTLSKNVYFLNNTITGTAGGYNGIGTCAIPGQGNTLVTIDVIGSTISGNIFNGVTTGSSVSLRTRGPAASIFCNTFLTGGFGPNSNCANIFLGSAAPLAGASPSTLAGIASANSFPSGGAYLTPNNAASYVIYRDLAQATAAAVFIGAGQAAVAAVVVANCPVLNVNTGMTFPAIQSAINNPLTLNGHTIQVAAGMYIENVIVNKSLTILGPNANIDPCTGLRVAEAIVKPSAIRIEPNTDGAIFRLGSGSGHIDVTIKGLTIDGSNPALGAGRMLNGVDVHTGAGIINSVGSFDLNPGGYDVTMTIQNNIIQNLERYGVLADGVNPVIPLAGTDVSHNKIDNLPSGNVYGGGRGRGIAFEENHYGSATYNCITRVNVGWQDDNYYLPSPVAATVVSNNTISSYHRGIFHNLQYQNASNATISNNTISAESSNNSGTDFGVEIASIQSGVGATVTGNNVTGKTYGLLLWNCPTTATINVSGGVLTNNTTGILATENDPQFGPAAASNYGISGVTITGGTTGLKIEGNTSVTTLTTSAFTGQSGDYIRLSNGSMDNQKIDATTCTFGGLTGGAATPSQNFAIEEKIHHNIEDKNVGFVTVKAMNAFVTDIVTATSTNNDYTRIRNAVELVANNWTINHKGTFDWTEANANGSWALGNDNVVSASDDYSILVPANLNGITFTAPDGLGTASITGPGDLASVNLEGVLVFDGGDNQNWTISNIEFNEFDLSIGMFNGTGGVDAFNGTTITNNTFNIATDLNATVAPADVNQNIGLHYSFGINQTISNNTFNVSGDGVSAGANFSSTVCMQSNTSGGAVYDGLLITGNTTNILNAQSANPQVVFGIWENAHGHTSNITISNNQFLNLAGGNNPALNLQRGFRVTSHSGPSTTVLYSGNTVQGANIGLQWISGSNFTGNNPVQVTANTINGNNTGILVQSNGVASILNNFIKNGANGIVIEGASAVTANNNDLASNSLLSIRNNGSLTAAATCNWYGSTLPATVALKISGLVTYIPWLSSGLDASIGTPGFQPTPGSCNGVPRPALTSTVNAVTVVDNNDATPDVAALAVCNTPASNLFFSGFNDLNNVGPVGNVRVRQEFTHANTAWVGPNPIDGDYLLSDYAGGFNRQIGLVNPGATGTLTMSFQVYYDANSNNVLDGSDYAGDKIIYTVTVNNSVGGTLNPPSSGPVCVGSNAGVLTLSGYNGVILRWEQSEDNFVTEIDNIGNAGNATYNYLNIAHTKQYRAVVQDGTCTPAYSSVAVVLANANSVAGPVTPASSSVCGGTNGGTLSLDNNIITGTVVKWQYSNDNFVADIHDIANTTLTQSYLNLTQTTYYRAVVQNAPCPPVYSNVATVIVNYSVGGTINPPSSGPVCVGSNAGVLTLSGYNGVILRWEQSEDNFVTEIDNIGNAGNATYNYLNIAHTKQYRAVIQYGACAPVYSSVAVVLANGNSVAGPLGPNATVCAPTNSGMLSLDNNIITGAVVKWQYSNDNFVADIHDIANTTLTQSYLNLTQTTYYRAVVQNSPCPPVYSDVAIITVNTPAAITCPADKVVNTDPNVCTAVVNYVAGISGTPSPIVTYAFTGVTPGSGSGTGSGATFNKGVTTVKITVTNGCGSTDCMFTVTVNDGQVPNVITKTGLVLLDGTGSATITPALVDNGSNDNCGPVTLSVAPNTFTCSDASHIAYQVPAGSVGNQAWPGELGMKFTVNAAAGIKIAQLGAFDDGGNGITGTVRVAIYNSALTIVPGLDVSITGSGDPLIKGHRMRNIPTVILPPGNYTIVAKGYSNAERNGNVGGGSPLGTTNNGGGLISFGPNPVFGNNNPAGFVYPTNADGGPVNRYYAGTMIYSAATTNIVTLTATDANSNSNSAPATVSVIDNIVPVITCPSTVNVQCAGNVPAQNPGSVTATDNCGTPTVTWVSDVISSQTCANRYTITRTYRATDASGNFAQCTQTIIVNDNTKPLVAAGPIASCYATVAAAETAALAATGATDNCTGALTKVASTVGTCSAVITVTVTDGCGNNDFVVYNTRIDNTAPVISTSAVSGYLGCNPSVTAPVFTGLDNCYGIFTPVVTSAGPSNIGCAYTQAWNANYTDLCGNPATQVSITYTWTVVTAPVIANAPAGGALGCNPTPPICDALVTASNECGTVPVTCTPGTIVVNGCNRTQIFTYTATACGLSAIPVVVTYTWTVDVTPPVITCPSNFTVPAPLGTCSAVVTFTPEQTPAATDNCGVVTIVNVPASGSTFPIGKTTVVSTATDACGNTSTCSFDVTVVDFQNATDFIIYAEKDVNFDEYHIIRGNVGVTAANGKADFKKNTVLDPYSITAKNISVQVPSLVGTRIFSQATGGPTPTFLPYDGTAIGLNNINVNSNVPGVLNGNWKDVTIKKGITVTVNGNSFGKFKIEEGATVTFTAAVINMKELSVEKGKKNDNILTTVNFAQSASVKIKDKVTIDDDTRVNVGGPKVTFYAGDNTGGDEKFEVKGENSQVTANVMVPNGKLHVHGGNDVTRPTIMTGWYIIEKLDGHGKYVYWNKYDCNAPAPLIATGGTNRKAAVNNATVVDDAKNAFNVNVSPNPSTTDFRIQVKSTSEVPVSIRIFDVTGRTIKTFNNISSNSYINVGSELRQGSYFAEVLQGTNRQTIKLLKME